MKLTHGGVELFYGNPLLPDPDFALRMGLSQGFLTYGGTLRLGVLVLEAAVYGRDISNTSSPREDRRFVGLLTTEF
jgi:hypothetical protein